MNLFTQNCNTALAHMVHAGEKVVGDLGLEEELNWKGLDLPDDNGNEYWTPGIKAEFDHSLFDKLGDWVSSITDSISGGAKNDDLSGSKWGDLIDGGDGDDIIDGKAGNDKLYGGEGGDSLTGGLGNDLLDGGEGLFVSYFFNKHYSLCL